MANLRGSPEAVEKRKVARTLNTLLTRKGSVPPLDGRTERRRKRLRAELREGTRDITQGLKPIEVLQHVHALLELGDTVESLRELVTVHPQTHIDTDSARALIERLQRSYNFRPEAYGFLGLVPETPGVTNPTGDPRGSSPPRRGRPPRAR